MPERPKSEFDAGEMRVDLERIKERLHKLSQETQAAFDRLQIERDDQRRRRSADVPPPPAA